jgi:hypothetical protein
MSAPGPKASAFAVRKSMATTAVEPVFVDTNVLVFANTATAPLHNEARAALQSCAGSGAELW